MLDNRTLIEQVLMKSFFIDQYEVERIPREKILSNAHFYNKEAFFSELEMLGGFSLPRESIPDSLTLFALNELVEKYRK